MTKLITPQELDELEKIETQRTQGNWHFVDQPWWDGTGVSHVVAGNPDPHIGSAVLNGIDIDSMDGEDDLQIEQDWVAAEAEMNANLLFAAAAATYMRPLINTLKMYIVAFERSTTPTKNQSSKRKKFLTEAYTHLFGNKQNGT